MYIIEEGPHIEIAKKRLRVIAFFLDYISFVIIAGISFKTLKIYYAILIPFLFLFILWPFSEALFGQTFGKRILDLKVVNHDLTPASFGQTLTRFIFAIIDMQLCIGLIVASIDRENRRIGDRVANTLVIKKTYLQSAIIRKQ